MRCLVVLPLLLTLWLPARLAGQYSRRRGSSSAGATSGPYGGPAVTFHGTVKAVSKKELTLDLDPQGPDTEPQTLTFRLTKKTKFMKGDAAIKLSDIEAGAHVSLDATREGDAKLAAVNVMVPSQAKAANK